MKDQLTGTFKLRYAYTSHLPATGPKSVLHVQNCCFANLTLLLFWPSCCHCILTSEATTECVVRELTIYVGRITYIFKDKHVVLLFEHDTGKVLLKNKKFRSRLRINSSRYSLLYLHSLDRHDDLPAVMM